MALPLKKKTEKIGEKISEQISGYMELPGAVKDGGCLIVDVRGGVSKDLGCCNLFFWDGSKKLFSCGTCKHED